MRPENRRFRPLGAMDILDEVVEIYKTNFVLLLGVAAIIYVPLSVINAIIHGPADKPSGIDLITILMMPIEAIVAGALAYGISERYLGKPVSIIESYSRILNHGTVWRLLGAVLIKYAVTLSPVIGVLTLFFQAFPSSPEHITTAQAMQMLAILGLLFLSMIWMLVFSIKFLAVEPTLVVEGRGAFASLGRSWKLTGGHFWKITGVYLLVGLVWTIVVCTLVLPASLPVAQKIRLGEHVSTFAMFLPVIIQSILSALFIPFIAGLRIVFYYDLRIRKEAFDLELLAAELSSKTEQTMAGDITSLPQENLSVQTDEEL